MSELTVVRTRICRRSDRIMKLLDEEGIPYRVVYAETPEGEELVERYGIQASPGIIYDGRYMNVVELMGDCSPEARKRVLRAIKGLTGG